MSWALSWIPSRAGFLHSAPKSAPPHISILFTFSHSPYLLATLTLQIHGFLTASWSSPENGGMLYNLLKKLKNVSDTMILIQRIYKSISESMRLSRKICSRRHNKVLMSTCDEVSWSCKNNTHFETLKIILIRLSLCLLRRVTFLKRYYGCYEHFAEILEFIPSVAKEDDRLHDNRSACRKLNARGI